MLSDDPCLATAFCGYLMTMVTDDEQVSVRLLVLAASLAGRQLTGCRNVIRLSLQEGLITCGVERSDNELSGW